MFNRVEALVRDVRELKTEERLAEAPGKVTRDLGFRFFAHAPRGGGRKGFAIFAQPSARGGIQKPRS